MKTLVIIIALFLAMKPAFSQTELAALDNSVHYDQSVGRTDEYASVVPPDVAMPEKHYSLLHDNVVLNDYRYSE